MCYKIKLSIFLYYFLIFQWIFGIIEEGYNFFVQHIHTTLFLLISIFNFIIFLFLLFKKKFILNFTIIEKNFIFIYLLYIFVSLGGVLYSPTYELGFVKELKHIYWLSLMIVTLIYYKYISYDEFIKFLQLIGTFSLFFLLFMTIFKFMNNYSFLSLLSGKTWFDISLFSDRNVFIEVLLYSFLFLVFKDLSIKKNLFFIYSLGLLFLILIIGILTGSRRVFVEVFLFIFFIFTFYKNSRYKFYLFLLIGIFLVGMNIKKLDINISDYMNQSSSIGRSLSLITGDKSKTSNLRTIEREIAFNTINSFNIYQILFGYGTSSYFYFYKNDYPHNFVLSVLIEGGILKFFILSVYLFYVIFNYVKYRNYLYNYEKFLIISLFFIYLLTRSISNQEFINSKLLLFFTSIYIYFFNESIKRKKEKINDYLYK